MRLKKTALMILFLAGWIGMITFASAAETANVAAEKSSDEAIEQAAEEMLKQDIGKTESTEVQEAGSAGNATAAAKTEVTSEAAKESEIPVVLGSKKAEHSGGGFLWRLVAALGLLVTVGGCLIYATRRWQRPPNVGGKTARIEILHQYHLGSRRSLALVRVAGEIMMVGITDHNINMLKSVALIDDEVEGLMNKDFNNFLEDEFAIEDVRSVLTARA